MTGKSESGRPDKSYNYQLVERKPSAEELLDLREWWDGEQAESMGISLSI